MSERVMSDEICRLFREFLENESEDGQISEETFRMYYGQVNAFLSWCDDSGLGVATASHEDLKAYPTHLRNEGYARSTIAGRLNSVRRFYAMARARGFRHGNPAEGLKAPRDLTGQAERVKWLPLGAIQQLLDAPDLSNPLGIRDRAVLMLMCVHGLRRMEVARLQVEEVNLELMEMSVFGKGRKRRSVDLIEDTKAALEKWLEVRPTLAAKGETALFVGTHGGGNGGPGHGISVTSMNRIVDKYLEALGLKAEGISCNTLRHSYATLSVACGARLDLVSPSMGHSRRAHTLVYVDDIDPDHRNPALILWKGIKMSGSSKGSRR